MKATIVNRAGEEPAEYLVVVNDQGQYALWPACHDVPADWKAVGPRGSRADCLRYIDDQWAATRPRGVVEAMSGAPSDMAVETLNKPAQTRNEPFAWRQT